MAWTDERMDALADQMAAGFARTDRQIEAQRAEAKADVGALRTDMKAGFDALRTEVKADIEGLRTEVKADIGLLHAMMFRFFCVMFVAVFGLMAALIGLLAGGAGAG